MRDARVRGVFHDLNVLKTPVLVAIEEIVNFLQFVESQRLIFWLNDLFRWRRQHCVGFHR